MLKIHKEIFKTLQTKATNRVETTIQAEKETKRTGTIIQVEMGINKMVITVKTVKEIIISLKAIQ